MDRLYQTTVWNCAWGSVFGGLFGAIIDFLVGTSGLLATVLAIAGSFLGSYLGFRIGLKDVGYLVPRTNFPLEVINIRKQHGAMWALMGAMVGGVIGSMLGTGVAAVGWVFYISHVPTMMDFMPIVNVMMGGGMGGMAGGVSGAWWSAMRAGFIGEQKTASRLGVKKKSQI